MNTGMRAAHSGCGNSPCFTPLNIWSGMKCTPSSEKLPAWIQKSKTGLDQNQPSCAHQVLIQSSRDRSSRDTSP